MSEAVTVKDAKLTVVTVRLVLTTLIVLIGLVSCKDKVREYDFWNRTVEDLYKDLKKTREIEFGGGDVWGTTYIFNNADSSVVKVLVNYDAGDYGRGQNEYLVVNNRLIYQRDSLIDWVVVNSPSDSNRYKLVETVCYFNVDSIGTKTTRAVYSMTFDFDEEKKFELRSKTGDSVALTKSDYIKLIDEMRSAVERRLIVE